MPNYCYNIVSVEGDSKEIAKLAKLMKSKESVFDFNKILPYPEKFAVLDKKRQEMEDAGVDWKELPKDGYNSGGYEWCIANWGTKWNAIEPSVDSLCNGGVAYSFDTAWSPCSEVVSALAVKFPTLRFTHEYEEGGCDFSGRTIYENGECILDVSGNYNDFPITEHTDWEEEDEEE